MTPAARSVRAFAVYLFVLALVLLFAPNTLLALFRMPTTTEVWIRVVGMLVAILAMYYWTAAAAELTPFFRATVLGRTCVALFLLAFVLAGWSSWPLVLFGGVDLAGAAWTWTALRGEGTAR